LSPLCKGASPEHRNGTKRGAKKTNPRKKKKKGLCGELGRKNEIEIETPRPGKGKSVGPTPRGRRRGGQKR